MMHGRAIDGGVLRVLGDADAIRAAHAAGMHVWVDIGEPSPETAAFLNSVFGVHPLIVEDIFGERSVPKIDEFDTHVYVVVHAIGRADDPLNADLGLLDVVIGSTFVLTQHREGPATGRLADLVEKHPALLERGPAWLAHAFIDGLVDRYEPHMNALHHRIDALEEHVLARSGAPDAKDILPELFALRRSIQSLCRTTGHQRQLVETLSRRPIAQIPEACRLYFRDVYDHLTRVDERADDYKDNVTSLVDAYLTVQSNRMNDTVKRLTLMSTVLLPLNFIASFYGMNFKHMPELSWPWGRELALAEMATLALLVWGWFKARRWV
jgi:magnesium transporter